MKLKKIVVGIVALFLVFGTVTPAFAMIPPAESTIFTIDADPSEIQRVAFSVLCDDMKYYREVEGYLLPEGTSITMDNDVFLSNSYGEMEYYHYDFGPHFGEPTMSYDGFSTYQILGEEGSNTITIDGTGLYVVIATKDGRTEWMYFASELTDEKCYRILEEGETVDSRRRVAQQASTIYICDGSDNKYQIKCMEDWIRPVTFEIDENGTKVELDGFIVKESVSVGTPEWNDICQIEWNLEEYLGQTELQQNILNGTNTGWYLGPSMSSGWSVSSTLSMITYDGTPFALQGDGLWIATEEITGITYRDRYPRLGEIEIVTPEAGEEIKPIRLNKLNNYLSTTAKGEDIKKVLFQVGDEKKEGYVFPADSYVGINKEIFDKGLYDQGYYEINEDGTIAENREITFNLFLHVFDEEGLMNTGAMMGSRSRLYHILMTDPATGEVAETFLAFDEINPNSYEVLEVEVIVEETEPDTQEPEPETQESESEDMTTENPPMNEEQMEEQGGLPAEGSIVEVSAIAVAATVFAGVISAAGAGFMPSIEVSSGVKARRGELHVNGDVDVPDVHFENLEKLVVPVHVSDGEGIVWAIVANAFTPGFKDLVKATAVPVGTDGANINLKVADDFKEKVKEETTVYLEVVATGFDVNGECNLLEKMVEINIVIEK